jgi:hypothetical protein
MSSPDSGVRLLPYERRLVTWQLRRWRAGTRFDIDKTERDDGPERVRLLAAYSAGFLMARIVGILGVAAGLVFAEFFGSIGFVVGFGVPFVVFAVTGAIAVRRQWQSEDARKEHRRGIPLTHQ